MPVFHHKASNQYVLNSYKVLFSLFADSPAWSLLGEFSPRVAASIVRRNALFRTTQIVRNPYDRLVSCFKDKFRKQPLRIHEQNFEWQACHKIMFPFCRISPHDPSHVMAQRFLEMSFPEFLEILPRVYQLEEHFHPQVWSSSLSIGKSRRFRLPFVRVIRMEEKELLAQIPDVNFSVTMNSTADVPQDFELDEHARSVIRTIYKDDFVLGRYSF